VITLEITTQAVLNEETAKYQKQREAEDDLMLVTQYVMIFGLKASIILTVTVYFYEAWMRWKQSMQNMSTQEDRMQVLQTGIERTSCQEGT
jgi:hypothetical protein